MSSGASRAKDVFLDALELATDERAAFVDDACAGDIELRERVAALLAAHESADRRLGEKPVAGASLAGLGGVDVGDSVGPYALTEVLGEGGFGVVFRAEQTEPVRRQVALKIVKLGMDTRAVVARFEAERQALAMMEHPNIARVLDGGATDTGRPFFVMELVDGVPITEYCAERGLGTKARLELFRSVCLAVQHAHQKGVIHRDIKPTNVLVAEIDGEPVPKVIDFGIAKATGERLTERTFFSVDGHLVGTPAYMSPEQAEGVADLDTRTDVYSLGVLLYELLAGAPPFDIRKLGFLELQRAILEDDPPRPSTQRRNVLRERREIGTGRVRLEVPADLDWIVLHALEKDRTRRYPTAFALSQDVERFLDDRPVEAAPPGPLYRIAKLARRHRVAAVSGGIVLLSMVLGVVGTSLGLVEAKRANRELDAALGLARAETERALDAEQRAAEEARHAHEAEERAASEAREARLQAGIAEEVNRFLNVDLLGAAAPSTEYGRGREVSMLEVLDRAGSTIEEAAQSGGRFEGLPLVEAAIRETIGNTYLALGEYDLALPQLERSTALNREALGEEAEDTLRTASLVAGALRRLRRLEESEAVLARVLPVQERVLGPAHADTVYSTARLARIRLEQERFDEAIELFETGLAEAEPVLGEDEDAVAWLMNGLATACATSGRLERAEELFSRLLELHRRRSGEESVDTAGAMFNLAKVHSARFRRDLAEPLFQEALAVQERLLGPNHPATLSTVQGLGYCWLSMGRPDRAAEMLERAVAGYVENDGERAVTTAEARLDLARVYQTLMRIDEAQELMERAHADLGAALPPDDSRVLQSSKDLAIVHLGAHRLDEAEALLDETLAHEREKFDPAHGDLQRTRLILSQLYLQTARIDEARALLGEGIEVALAAHPEGDTWCATFATRMASVLNRLGRYEEAERFGRDAIAWSRVLHAPTSMEMLTAMSELGTSLAGQERWEEAECFLLEAHGIAVDHFARFGFQVAIAQELARLYRRTGRPEEAARFE